MAREEPYTDYYVWKDPAGYDKNGNPLPPNNWVICTVDVCRQSKDKNFVTLYKYFFSSTSLLYKVPLKCTGKNFVKRYTGITCRIYNKILC